MPDRITRCIFCERTELSREHVWPTWMHDLVRREGFDRHVRKWLSTSPSSPHIYGERESIERSGKVITVRLKVVCKYHCNSGWMSRLEQRVIPILTPLIKGDFFILTKYHQELIATWIAMKLMVCEFSIPEDRVTSALERSLLMGRQRPSEATRLWIGFYDGSFWKSAYERHAALIGWGDARGPMPLPKDSLSKNIQSQTLGIGRVFIQSIGSTLGGLDFHSKKLPHNPLIQLWPFERNIVWPPPGKVVTDFHARAIASTLDRFMRQLLFSPGMPPTA
jgi:hypothetical protein